jgi:hypothetical protein
MLEKAREVTREGGQARVQYARFADDLVVLVDASRDTPACIDRCQGGPRLGGEEGETAHGAELETQRLRLEAVV